MAKKSRFIRIFFPIVISLVLSLTPVWAEDFQAKFQDWSFFKTNREDKVLCYIISTPIKQDSNYYKRGEPYLIVNHIVNDADEISISAGFYFKENSSVEMSFGAKKFYLFPYLNLAWANNKNDDIDILKQMQKSEEIIVSSIAKDGKIANDTYSLIGFMQAYLKMKKDCLKINN